MKIFAAALASIVVAWGTNAPAEILAMMNYESKTPDQLASLKLTGATERREGIAIIDVDPESPAFGKILVDIPLDPKSITHHIFYDRTMTKAYVTSLVKPALQVMDMTQFPPRLKAIDIPNCSMAEDVVFDAANENWYLTCMNSANAWRGSVATDEVTGEIKLPGTFPHGIAVDTGIDRILVTSTVSGDMKVPGDVISVIKASTLEPLGQVRVSTKAEMPAAEAPVEILKVPGADGTFYVTNMMGASLWTLTWDAGKQDFTAAPVFDFGSAGASMPLEMYFNGAGTHMYVTTAVPGQFHVFDMAGGAMAPKLIKSTATGGGAHHVGVTKDEKYGFVQNALLNLPGMDDGSVTVVDLASGDVVRSMDTLKEAGFNPNSLVLLPEWNSFAGH